MMTKYTLFLFIFIFSGIYCLNAEEDEKIRSGLHFYSFEVDKDKRTGLDLTPDKKLHAPMGFSLKFDLQLRIEVQTFGYIFRIVGNDTVAIDLIAYQFSKDGVFTLVAEKKTLIQYSIKEIGGNINKDWLSFEMKVNPLENTLSLSINNTEKVMDYNLSGLKDFSIYFGKNAHSNFYTTDVAPVTIRNLRLFNSGQQLIRDWKLGKHGDSFVLDAVEKNRATVINPFWEIDKHLKWAKMQTFNLEGQYYQFAFDKVNNRIFIVRDQRIIVYSTQTGETDTIIARKGYPYNVEPNQLVYDPVRDELLSYDYDENQPARFNFQSRTWNNENHAHIGTRFWHHGKYYLPQDSTLVLFGGYGQHHYSALLQKNKSQGREWEKTDLSKSLFPRYLGSMGKLNEETFLYFGGFGNETGNQAEGAKNYYELHEVNIEDYSVRRRWELQAVSDPFTNANSMVIDTARNIFYTLSYPSNRHASHLFLIEYQLDSPKFRVLADSLLYLFNDIDSYCDLFQSNDQRHLYALVSSVKNGASEINIYSIASPPLSPEDVLQKQESAPSGLFRFFAVAACVFCMGVTLFLRKRYLRKKIPAGFPAEEGGEEMEPSISFPPSSIHLLGNFKLIDRHGNEIKEGFSPTTQQFFITVLLFTLKNGNGVSSDELNKYFWEDKDDISARNSRNVYANKTRSVLKNMDGINIIKHKGYWKITLEKNVFCDYARVQTLISTVKKKENISPEYLKELVLIASRGTLLPYVETEWLDGFKSDFSNLLIETLTEISKKDEWKQRYDILLKIADTILLHDNTEEYSIRLKCYILLYFKRNSLAKQTFQKFINDYEKLLLVKPNFSFEDIRKELGIKN